jgi:hypothetical protein
LVILFRCFQLHPITSDTFLLFITPGQVRVNISLHWCMCLCAPSPLRSAQQSWADRAPYLPIHLWRWNTSTIYDDEMEWRKTRQ